MPTLTHPTCRCDRCLPREKYKYPKTCPLCKGPHKPKDWDDYCAEQSHAKPYKAIGLYQYCRICHQVAVYPIKVTQ